MQTIGYVYILTNKNHTVLYTGVSSNLEARLHEHKRGEKKNSFTYRYNAHKLVYYEKFDSIALAIKREKFIKSKNRKWKIDRINRYNPLWLDLSEKLAKEF
jgi:putative endonuclease